MLTKRHIREKNTVVAMIRLYCHAHHHTENTLCLDCQSLVNYSYTRIAYCLYKEDKPACSQCPVHCYKPDMRDRIKQVMRYSGPKMIFRHPIKAFWHFIDRFNKPRKKSLRDNVMP